MLVPKLEYGQILDRLRARLDELRQGRDVAARDLRALLTSEQVAAMDSAWAEQQALRKGKRARTKEEEAALGWKSKRDIHIEAYERAIEESDSGELEALKRKARQVEVRRARIYLDSYFEALAEPFGNRETAAKKANNDLTRAGLRRFDEADTLPDKQLERDREVREMELDILRQIKSEMSPDELEQLQLLKEHEKREAEFWKRRGK
ncbi:MAG: hypothetical protein CFE38_19115 [Comamonadaceae bacterium PBBC1]|nr:MAG: hypothetical protein CFE38_19115 [Comamonadaceae bacterium PBBC1]